jgi:hypothetical protein
MLSAYIVVGVFFFFFERENVDLPFDIYARQIIYLLIDLFLIE